MTGKKTPPRAFSATTDWASVQRRLRDVALVVQEGWVPGPEQEQEILKARTAAIAREPVAAESATEHIEIIEFLLAYEHYGIDSTFVREVYPMKDLTTLPCTPAFVLGIINVRGRILTVIDIKKFFDLPEKGLADLNKVIIVAGQGLEFGVLADKVIGVRTILRDAIQSTLPTVTGSRDHYLMGVTPERMVILDMARLLSDGRLIVREEVSL
ncbi:MAG: chemotaxis protein CheW [Acidiferrobacteraceae bacterium]